MFFSYRFQWRTALPDRRRSSLLGLRKELLSGLLAGYIPMAGRGVCLRHALTLRSSYCGRGNNGHHTEKAKAKLLTADRYSAIDRHMQSKAYTAVRKATRGLPEGEDWRN